MIRTLTSLITTDVPPTTTAAVPSSAFTTPSPSTTNLPSLSTATAPPTSPATPTAPASTQSSSATKIAIGVTVPVAAIFFLTALLLLYRRCRQGRNASATQHSLPELEAHSNNAIARHELDAKSGIVQSVRPLHADTRHTPAAPPNGGEAELPAHQHLYGGCPPVEIGASGVSAT